MHTRLISTKPDNPRTPDLIEHGCHTAAELLGKYPTAHLGYTDGSHVYVRHSGCAAVLVNYGEDGTIVHSMRVWESSAHPADLWALYLVLTYATSAAPLIVLSDCSSALQKLLAIDNNICEYYSHTHAHILRRVAHALRARQGPTHFAHIRFHVGFAGNERAVLFPRLAAYFTPPRYREGGGTGQVGSSHGAVEAK